MKKRNQGLQTKALHAGHTPDSDTGSRAVPIHMTTSYVFKDTEHAADLFALKEPGFIYTRLMNPTTDVLEKRLASMHGGAGALAVASGMSAVFYAVASIASAGQNIVTGSNLYDGSSTLFRQTLSRFGIEVRFVESSSADNFRAAMDQNTRLVYSEAIGNPRCNVDDLPAIAAVAHDHGVPFMLDCTSAPPPIGDPFGFGADIAVYSLTKIAGGHGTAMGGAIVEKGDFDWLGNERFPEICAPDPAYNGMSFWEALDCGQGKSRPVFCSKVRAGMLRDTGATISPMNSFLIMQGLETLPMRAERHCSNAQSVAEFLADHPKVDWVNYAGLADHPDNERARKLFPLGPGAVFGFGVTGGLAAGRRFIENVELCSHLANILDARTLVIHPASTTHSQSSPDKQRDAGVTPDMVRISVGLEDVHDIIADLDQALSKT